MRDASRNLEGWPCRARLYWAADVGSVAGSVVDASTGGELSLAGSSAAVLSLAGSGVSVSGVEEAVVPSVDAELTDSGGGTSRILDGEEGTDIGVAAAGDWLRRAA